ncbi:MAG: DUF3300 domain-containing protein, partial [Opitutaceae bacterium]
QLTAEQLDQLLGPIALYPDALIALILPAATVPSDVVLAGRYLAGEGVGPAQIDDQSWDDSVKALAHYPTVVSWMDQNLAWTKQLGEAFLAQPAEVMKSIQRLRAAARSAGTLVDTPQQQVLTQADMISIVPAERDVIYVPYYDPEIVYVRRPGYSYGSSFFSFSVGYPVGFWLGYNMDWNHRRIWMIDRQERERYWHDQRDWRRPTFAAGATWTRDTVHRPWTPNPVYVRPSQPQYRRSTPVVARPTPIARDTPGRSPSSYWNQPDRTEGTVRVDGTSTNTQRAVYSRSRNYQQAPSPAPQVQASAPAPQRFAPSNPVPAAATTTPSAATPRVRPPAYSRGERGVPPPQQAPQQQPAAPPATEQRSRETRESRSRSDVPRGQSNSSASNVRASASAAPAPASSPAPAASDQVSQPAASASSSAPAPAAPSASRRPAPTVYSRGSR